MTIMAEGYNAPVRVLLRQYDHCFEQKLSEHELEPCDVKHIEQKLFKGNYSTKTSGKMLSARRDRLRLTISPWRACCRNLLYEKTL